MAFEEKQLFPLADRLLTGADWVALEGEDPARVDPVFGKQVDRGYDRLYRTIIAPGDRQSALPIGESQEGEPPAQEEDEGYLSVRFGSFVQEASAHAQAVSYNYLTPKPMRDEEGRGSLQGHQAATARDRRLPFARALCRHPLFLSNSRPWCRWLCIWPSFRCSFCAR